MKTKEYYLNEFRKWGVLYRDGIDDFSGKKRLLKYKMEHPTSATNPFFKFNILKLKAWYEPLPGTYEFTLKKKCNEVGIVYRCGFDSLKYTQKKLYKYNSAKQKGEKCKFNPVIKIELIKLKKKKKEKVKKRKKLVNGKIKIVREKQETTFIKDSKLTRELILSQAKGKTTQQLHFLIYKMCVNINRKFSYNDISIQYDIVMESYLKTINIWKTFNHMKYKNSFPYVTEVIKRFQASAFTKEMNKYMRTNRTEKNTIYYDRIK